ncbi:MAG: DNA primase small subunit domain-containing protein [Candidatus Woesearchaeota archaeon]
MDISFSLSYYKKPTVQRAIVREAENKECSVRFGLDSFGKRPDVLSYERDVLELAKKKATSFHCSEELWYNPLSISTGMKRIDLDNLRKGWDLILDIDCPDWELSKLTTHMFVRALQEHDVKTIFCKFSGNKGFHIAVPFESFPENIVFEGKQVEVKNLFPEMAKKIALYLLSFITEKYAKVLDNKAIFLDKFEFEFNYLDKIAKQSSHTLLAFRCDNCKTIFDHLPQTKTTTYVCSKCGTINKPKGKPDLIRCSNCDFPVSPKIETSICSNCHKKSNFEKIFNFFSIVDVDTILIASRHLYRMPYSLHEKSELVSVPLNLNEILTFEKEKAKPENVDFNKLFIDRKKAIKGEATKLFKDALDFTFSQEEKNSEIVIKEVEVPETALSKDLFPPCIKNILKGLEDGKKRALFILINFLRSVGWTFEQIEQIIYEWNERNPEPLREQYLKGQLSQIKKNKKVVLPPSCSNKDYYKSLLICTPDENCKFIKNPVNYATNKSSVKPKIKKEMNIAPKKEIIIVNDKDEIISQKLSKNLDENDIYRYSILLIKNSADGVLLTLNSKSNKWGCPIKGKNQIKSTYETTLKKLAQEKIGLRTFVLREGKKFNPTKTHRYFEQWFLTLVDRTPTQFNLTKEFKDIKWFSKSELTRKFKENSSEFSKEVELILLENF